MTRLHRVLKRPGYYSRRLARIGLWKLSGIWGQKSFYLQGRMDIHPSSLWYNPDFIQHFGGFAIPGEPVERACTPLEAWDTVRQDMLVLLLRSVITRKIEGCFAELGVYKGLTARLIHHYVPERPLHLFDTFRGFTMRGSVQEQKATGVRVSGQQFADTSIESVRQFVSAQNDHIYYHQGYFPESVPRDLLGERFAFVHIDADLYDPIMAGLAFFYPRMSGGGLMVVHDYNAWIGARTAVEEFMADKPEVVIPMPDKSGSCVIVKSKPIRD